MLSQRMQGLVATLKMLAGRIESREKNSENLKIVKFLHFLFTLHGLLRLNLSPSQLARNRPLIYNSVSISIGLSPCFNFIQQQQQQWKQQHDMQQI